MKDDVAKDSLSAPATTATNSNHKKLKTINPATEEVLNEYELISKEQLNDTVKKSPVVLLRPLSVLYICHVNLPQIIVFLSILSCRL